MNKIDMVDKGKAVRTIWHIIASSMILRMMIPVCALRGINMETCHQCDFQVSCRMVRNIYDDDTITDQPQRQIVAEMIREKALALSGRGDSARHRCGDRPDAGATGRNR